MRMLEARQNLDSQDLSKAALQLVSSHPGTTVFGHNDTGPTTRSGGSEKKDVKVT
jgi:hypothetical protein